MRIFRWWLVVVVLVAFGAGCPVDDDDDDASDDDVADDDTGDDDTGDDATGDDDTGPPAEPYVTGTVYDVTCTTPLEGIRVTICQTDAPCTFTDTDASGQFLLDGLFGEIVGEFRVPGYINASGTLLSGVIAEFEVPTEGSVELADVCLPLVPEVVALPESGPQEVEAGDGLVLTLDPDAVMWLMETPQVGAVEVPQNAWAYIEQEGVEVLGAWAMYAWGNKTEEIVGARMPFRGDVDCDDEVTIYMMSDTEVGLLAVGQADLDCDQQTVSTRVGEGLTELTWVFYGRPG